MTAHTLAEHGFWDYTCPVAGGMEKFTKDDYMTHCRLEIATAIDRAIRARGFKGELAMICGLGGGAYETVVETSFELLHERLPDCGAVTYCYENYLHRYSMKDLGISVPKSFGIKTFYLPRGVMTWGMASDRPSVGGLSLEEHWQMDVEDVELFRPQGLWWFGCGTINDGVHVSLSKLRQLGYQDGADARRALLRELPRNLRLIGSAVHSL